MKKVGIVPSGKLFLDNDPYHDEYVFVNNYGKRIVENGGSITGLIPVDGLLSINALDDCDGFLIPGGTIINKYHLQVIDYAIKNHKPLLGICLGMQAICLYDFTVKEAQKRNIDLESFKNLDELKKSLKEENIKYLVKETEEQDNIHNCYVDRDTINSAKHDVFLNDGTILYDIYKKNIISKPSMHGYKVSEVSNNILISGMSEDGVIEAIEVVGRNIIGVQFHPELEENDELFKWLIDKC